MCIKLKDQPKEDFFTFLQENYPHLYEDQVPSIQKIIVNRELVIETDSVLFPYWREFDEVCG